MKKFSLLILILSVSFTGNAMTPKMKQAYKVIDQFVNLQTKQDNLHAIGTGLSAPEEIQSLHVHFVSNQRLDVNEARKMLVNGVDEFLKLINEDTGIRPYLIKYPFNSKNIQYKVCFEEKNGDYVEQKYVAYLFLIDGVIYYCSYDKAHRQFNDLKKETFEEAKQILAKQKLEKSEE